MRRDLDDTRTRLVASATEEFSRFGIAGARVNRIAEQAGVNKERIYGIFGSKDALFDAVLQAAMDRHAADLGLPGRDMAAWSRAVHDFYRDNPDLLRLLMWQALEDGRRPAHPRHAERYVAKVEALAVARGRPADAEVATSLLGVVILAMLPALMPQFAESVVGPYADGRPVEDIVRETIADATGAALAEIRERSSGPARAGQ